MSIEARLRKLEIIQTTKNDVPLLIFQNNNGLYEYNGKTYNYEELKEELNSNKEFKRRNLTIIFDDIYDYGDNGHEH